MSSIPASVMAVDQNDLNPNMGPSHSFDRAVVLFDNIIEILCLWPEASHSQFNAGLMVGVVIVDRGRMVLSRWRSSRPLVYAECFD